MPFARLRSSIIAARDERQDILQQYLRRGYPATVFLALNISGPKKDRPGTGGLFAWAQTMLETTFPDRLNLSIGQDALGPYAVMHVDRNAIEAKRLCIGIETARPSARLVDLDVYDVKGEQIDRGCLGLPPRQCLVCDQPAMECMRVNRHTSEEIITGTDELLAHIGS
ncbi:MAG: citrate lyase holo-[acyl-carrier protein] synthase [Opitutaceae bacterium]|nr:citrate lyase holo-[acyl-carrier protein] synthase [Opitutaceae bacterium]